MLRLDSGGWWSGHAHDSTGRLQEVAVFDSPAACREAMQEVGWVPTRPGWIEPLRAATQRRPAQLALAL